MYTHIKFLYCFLCGDFHNVLPLTVTLIIPTDRLTLPKPNSNPNPNFFLPNFVFLLRVHYAILHMFLSVILFLCQIIGIFSLASCPLNTVHCEKARSLETKEGFKCQENTRGDRPQTKT